MMRVNVSSVVRRVFCTNNSPGPATISEELKPFVTYPVIAGILAAAGCCVVAVDYMVLNPHLDKLGSKITEASFGRTERSLACKITTLERGVEELFKRMDSISKRLDAVGKK